MKGICSNKNITLGAGKSLDRSSLPPSQKRSTYCYWCCRRFSALLLSSGRAWLTQHTRHTQAGRQDSLVGFETSHWASLWFLVRKSASSHPPGLLALEIAADHLCWFQDLKREIALFSFFGGIKPGTVFSRYGLATFHGRACLHFKILKVQS